MPELSRNLKDKGVALKKIHLLNEVPFLAKVEKTPTFLVYERSSGKFKEVSLEGQDNDDVAKDDEEQKSLV